MKLTWKSPFTFAKALWRMFVWEVESHSDLIVKAEKYEARKAICNKCAYKDGGQCRLCTCWIEAKIWFNSERCPDKRW